MKKIKLLDCTLRDGGYYCDWIYSDELVQEYLNTMASSGIDYVEIGLRSNVSNKFLGPFAYCTDNFLNKLNLPKTLKIGVMINAAEFISGGEAQLDIIERLFSNSANSPVKLVRIASHLNEVKTMIPVIKELHKKGYTVGLNIMQIGGKTVEQINSVLKDIKDLNELEVLYFADSLGNMRPENVNEITKIFKDIWTKDIGIHTHDNMGMALSNSLEAVSCGVTWVDGTILGMGRGAGNVRTEYLLLEAQERNWGDFHPDAVFPLVQGKFSTLQSEYNWGTNLLYYISAQYKIHPTYVQTLLTNHNYSSDRLLEILKKLSSEDSSSYSTKKLNDAIAFGNIDCDGDWNPKTEAMGEEILIIGSGDTCKNHLEAINEFINTKKITVFSLNINQHIAPEKVSYYVASHPLRILFDFEMYKKLRKPLVAPLALLKKYFKGDVVDVDIKNLGLKITESKIGYENGAVIIPNSMAISYTLALLTTQSVKKAYLVGFDGYAKGDPKNAEVQAVFDLFKKSCTHTELISLTPTSYDLKQSSIYANFI